MPENRSCFESPLAITFYTEFTEVKFGCVLQTPEVIRLRKDLNNLLFNTAFRLPNPLNKEAHSIISRYSGGDGDFYRLFYVPIWSFLHWVPLTCNLADVELINASKTAHALSLFLHLWDDHLCDGQLPVDLLRLQLRTIAWQQMILEFTCICQKLGFKPAMVEEYTSKYLTSLHFPKQVNSLEEYCERFKNQVSIWTLVPYLLGYCMGGHKTAGILQKAIEHFSISWRLIDDIQDIHLDLLAGEKTVVLLELDDTGHKLWSLCFSKSRERGKMDQESWLTLAGYIRESGCLKRLLDKISEHLKLSIQAASIIGLESYSLELEQTLVGISTIK